MGCKKVFQLRPSNYPDLEDEKFKLSANDHAPLPMFAQRCVFFSLPDDEREPLVEQLKAGLEKTLDQCRFLAGTIEKDEQGGYFILSKKESTVTFSIHRLDNPTGDSQPPFPSYEDLEANCFNIPKSCNSGELCLQEMEFRSNSENSSLDSSPPILGLQANFIPGGIALAIHNHHTAMDFGGVASFLYQWADNTRALRVPTQGLRFSSWPWCYMQ